ncbi:MAG: preprotein translocase subunit SecG [Verrucomicrobiales bacterium]|nr:preprotein translocase subunit SecG [Verrucomicrobiales bacterium]
MILGWLNIAINLVVIAHVVVSLLLILVILMQRPKQEGLGAAFGSGMTDAAWGARTTDVLQKGTVYLGTLFFVFSLVLAILFGKRNAIEGKRADEDGASSESAEQVVVPAAPEDVKPVDPAEEFKRELESVNRDNPEEDAPTEGTPTEDTPTEEGSTEEGSTEESPTEDTPTEEAPAPAGA